MREPDFVRKKFAPLLDRGLQQALAQRLGKEFPRLGGPRILDLCAQMVLEVVEEQIRPRESHGMDRRCGWRWTRMIRRPGIRRCGKRG